MPSTSDPVIDPPLSLLVKLGSIAVHADELLSPGGHAFDRTAIEQLLKDQEVVDWMGRMDKKAMLPKKRTTTAGKETHEPHSGRKNRDQKPRRAKGRV